MEIQLLKGYTAFAGARRVATGDLADVAIAAKVEIESGVHEPVLIFDNETGKVVDVDYRGSEADIRERIAAQYPEPAAPNGNGDDASPYRAATPRGRGRPRLGVVAREVTLLPRHWEWLAKQPGGASAAVRRLVDAARQENVDKDRVREARESAYRFMSAMAGNEPGFEEATRALFAGNEARFLELTEPWPRDVREYVRTSASRAFAA